MRAWRLGVVAGALAAVMTIGLASCGDDDDDGGAAAPPQVEADRMRLEIQSAAVPDPAGAGTVGNRPTVRFRVIDEEGAAVNLEAEMATTATFPRTTGPRFTLAMLDDDGNYRSYYEATRQPAAYTFTPDPEVIGTRPFTLPTPAARTQATSPTLTASDLRPLGGGVYEYTFPPATVTTTTGGLDRTKTHTVAGWISRNPSDGVTSAAGGSFNFVPSGGGPVARDEVVNDGTTSCGRCHAFVQAHGSRRGVQLCITCHSPQTGDPETNRTVDFKVMIHKIHAGSALPSVEQGIPYFIVGNRQSVHDWSELAFPWHDHGVQHCTVCHSGGEDSNNWKTKPSQAACTSCHDNVQFSGSLPSCSTLTATNSFQNCLHSGGVVGVTNPNSSTSCVGCHAEGSNLGVEKFHHGD